VLEAKYGDVESTSLIARYQTWEGGGWM